jgi:hypothetical protein
MNMAILMTFQQFMETTVRIWSNGIFRKNTPSKMSSLVFMGNFTISSSQHSLHGICGSDSDDYELSTRPHGDTSQKTTDFTPLFIYFFSLHIVVCRPIATKWLFKQRLLPGNGHNRFLTCSNEKLGSSVLHAVCAANMRCNNRRAIRRGVFCVVCAEVL